MEGAEAEPTRPSRRGWTWTKERRRRRRRRRERRGERGRRPPRASTRTRPPGRRRRRRGGRDRQARGESARGSGGGDVLEHPSAGRFSVDVDVLEPPRRRPTVEVLLRARETRAGEKLIRVSRRPGPQSLPPGTQQDHVVDGPKRSRRRLVHREDHHAPGAPGGEVAQGADHRGGCVRVQTRRGLVED